MFYRAMVIATLFLALMTLGSGVSAQQPIERDESAVSPPDDPAQSDLNDNINFCRGLMRDRNYGGASALLETLYEKYPDNSVIISLLIQCYDQLQYYAKAGEIISRYLERAPSNFNMQLMYAEILAKQNNFDAAEKIYRQVASTVAISNTVRLQAIVQSMARHNLGDRLIAFVDSLRVLTSDSTLFALQRGTVLEGKGLYRQAVLEFYPLLEDTARTGNDAEKRIIALLDFVDSQKEAEVALLEQPDLAGNVRALKILSTYYLKSGQFDKAFEFTISRDSLEGADGKSLLAYIQTCSERKLYQQAARMGEYFFSRKQTYRPESGAYLVYADALVKLKRYDGAIAILDSLFAISKHDGPRVEALHALGVIYLEELGDYNRALEYFDSVQFHYTRNPAYLAAVMARPMCYLRTGELEKAAAGFEAGLELNPPDEVREKAGYYKALILFFEKQIDSSRAAFNKLLVDHPRGYYVNDAVRLMVLIDEAKDHPEQLFDYSNALLFEQRRMLDSSMAKLSLIAGSDGGVLADVALLKLAELSLSRQDTAAAINFVDSLAGRFPESYYRPYGMKMKADLLVEDSGKLDQAIEIYRSLLESYSNYPFIPAVRLKMRELRESPGSA